MKATIIKNMSVDTGLTQQDPERFVELSKALLVTPQAQAMIRESGTKTYDDLSGGKGLVAQMFKPLILTDVNRTLRLFDT